MLDSGVHLTTVECAYGDRPYELNTCPHVTHVPVRSKSLVWNKECMINRGMAGGATLGRTLLSAAMRNLGWREPSPRPDGDPPIIGATRRGQSDEPNLTVHQGRQDKHILGTNNYIKGRSLLIAKAKDLIARFAGRGEQVGSNPVGKPGSIEAFDTARRL